MEADETPVLRDRAQGAEHQHSVRESLRGGPEPAGLEPAGLPRISTAALTQPFKRADRVDAVYPALCPRGRRRHVRLRLSWRWVRWPPRLPAIQAANARSARARRPVRGLKFP